MGDCCGNTFRCLFIFFNVIFSLVGAATMGFGIFLKVSPQASQLLDLVELSAGSQYLTYGAYVIITFGAIVFIVSFFGCVGACTRNRVLLGLYVLLALIVIAGEIAAFVFTLLFVIRSKDISSFEREVTNTFQDKYRKDATKYTKPWDSVQAWFSCCGISNHTDYRSVFNVTGSDVVPLTCCRLGTERSADAPIPVDKVQCLLEARQDDPNYSYKYLHSRGCFTLLKNTITEYSTVLLIIEAVIIAITLIGVIIACCLCRRHKEKDLN